MTYFAGYKYYYISQDLIRDIVTADIVGTKSNAMTHKFHNYITPNANPKLRLIIQILVFNSSIISQSPARQT